jgi:DNA-binding NarL/FixJ family response regulator
MTSLRLLIADDHSLLRVGIRTLLDHLDGIEVIAEASNGHEALALIEQHRPDLVLTDIAMPGLNGLDVAERVSQDFPEIKTIILTMHSDEEYVCRALRAGAVGYLLKDSGIAELERAIRAIARGESYLSPAVSRRVISDYIRRTGTDIQSTQLLTARQREVLRSIALGQTTKSIARILGISVKTVEAHRAQLMERLEIHDVAGLVRYAIRTGLATLDE